MAGHRPTGEILNLRQLSRATLARQMLLAREPVAVVEAVARLGGMQAQEAKPPMIGLWTRLAEFRREDLLAALHGREVVRGTLMRATLHLMSAADYLAFRPLLQPVMTRAMGVLGARAEGLEVEALLPVARALLDDEPRTFTELRALLQEHFPDVNDRALGYAVRCQLPLVMLPTADRWGFPPAADFTLAERWLGAPLAGAGPLRTLVTRYLAAFGPASVADAQTWSGLQGLKVAFEAMRPELRTFRDERGRELFDLPDAPRPDPDTAAPPRFLPEFDNLVLAHADRARVIADAHRPHLVTKNLRVRATFLVDGFVRGTWEIERKRGAATLRLHPFEPLAENVGVGLAEEGERLLRFVEDDATTFTVQL